MSKIGSNNIPTDLYEYLQDHDNADLNEDEWHENMRQKVHEYNQEHGTNWNPQRTIGNYLRTKNHQDQ
jgi:ABC-type glutathione transport system ATPase component